MAVDWPVVAGATLLFVLPGAWIGLSGLLSVRAALAARRRTPVAPSAVDAGPTATTGRARPLVDDELLPTPGGETLVCEYRLVRPESPGGPVDSAETLCRGSAAVPMVLVDSDGADSAPDPGSAPAPDSGRSGDGADDGVLVEPRGARTDLDARRVHRFDRDPPEPVAAFLSFVDEVPDLDPQAAFAEGAEFALVVRAIAPGDRTAVAGAAERVDPESVADAGVEADVPDVVVRRGTGRVPLVVADGTDVGAGPGTLGRGLFETAVGLAMALPGLGLVLSGL